MKYIIGIDEVGRAASRRRASPNYIIGIDEVGRGSLAGPVTVAAVAMPTNYRLLTTNYKLKLRDSKRLSPRQRDAWLGYIKNHSKVLYAVSHVQPSVIDRINISQAANRAASKALRKLLKNKELRIKNRARICLDGGLYLEENHKAQISQSTNKSQSTNFLKHKQIKAKTIIRGDEKIKAIMLASIVAKVTRDRLMARLHKKYPKYGFARHKGYGTQIHIAAVRRFGPSKKHRLTFI